MGKRLPRGCSGDDADYWRLTNLEKVRFYSRLSTYHARRSRQLAAESARLSDKAIRWLTIAAVFLGIALLVQIFALVARATQ